MAVLPLYICLFIFLSVVIYVLPVLREARPGGPALERGVWNLESRRSASISPNRTSRALCAPYHDNIIYIDVAEYRIRSASEILIFCSIKEIWFQLSHKLLGRISSQYTHV